MIISASRRTDIPAAYADWFMKRLAAGYVLVRNPVNPRQVGRVSLAPKDVDGIVFWTKNPAPMLEKLDALASYAYYFQCTITPYGEDLEPGVPDKAAVIAAVKRLADLIGPERVVWRYDPILLSDTYTMDDHADAFAKMAMQLRGYTRGCIISFVDDYRNTARNAAALALAPISEETMLAMARTLSGIARSFDLPIDACAEAVDLSASGVGKARCVDATLLGMIRGMPIAARKDRNQRVACACHQSIDIGAYNTCPNGCLYCYANYDEKKIPRNIAAHDVDSALLIGGLLPDDTIYDR